MLFCVDFFGINTTHSLVDILTNRQLKIALQKYCFNYADVKAEPRLLTLNVQIRAVSVIAFYTRLCDRF
jgi:hypothetical protein